MNTRSSGSTIPTVIIAFASIDTNATNGGNPYLDILAAYQSLITEGCLYLCITSNRFNQFPYVLDRYWSFGSELDHLSELYHLKLRQDVRAISAW